MKNRFLLFLSTMLIFCIVGCEEETLPKPKAMLRLEFPKTTKSSYGTDDFLFDYNGIGKVQQKNKNAITIDYPDMSGTIFLSYKPVENNLKRLLSDAQKLSYEHAAKADNIMDYPFVNEMSKVYGMFYDVKGDAASQAQFYVTDSSKHFLTGSLYFNIKPNYDSIYPAAVYLQNDIRDLMESLRWRD